MSIWTVISRIPLFKNKLLYDPIRVSFYGYTHKSYDGYLYSENISTALNKIYPEIHVAKNFDFHDKDVIICPCIRSNILEFYKEENFDNRNVENMIFSKFAKYIYEEVPTIFIGNEKDYKVILEMAGEILKRDIFIKKN